jgi:hypothetical protein
LAWASLSFSGEFLLLLKDAGQKAAFGKMHEGEFLDALKTFEKAGRIHWTTRQSDSLRDMAERYTADLEASPETYPTRAAKASNMDGSMSQP